MTKERLYIFLLIYQKLIERLKLIFVNVIDGISLVKISFENTRFKNIIEKYNKKYYKSI